MEASSAPRSRSGLAAMRQARSRERVAGGSGLREGRRAERVRPGCAQRWASRGKRAKASSPIRARRLEDLPAPLAPMMATRSPLATWKLTPPSPRTHGLGLPVPNFQVPDLQHHRSIIPSARGRQRRSAVRLFDRSAVSPGDDRPHHSSALPRGTNCPRCGGRMKVIAVIEQDDVIFRFLSPLGLVSAEDPSRAPSDAVAPPPAPKEVVSVPVFDDRPFREAADARCLPKWLPPRRQACPLPCQVTGILLEETQGTMPCP
jgi:hypothetical protein